MLQWFVTLHLAGLLVFAAAHGVSIWVAFQVRGSTDRGMISMLLATSQRALMVSNIGLIALGIGGLGAAANLGSLTAPWVVGSYVAVVVVFLAMAAIGSGFYYRLRDAVLTGKGEPLSDEELFHRLDNRRPEALAITGGIGTLILVWLMVFKPGT